MNALLLAGWIACQALDGGTTYYALHSGRFHEGNALMRGPHLAAVKLSVNVAALLAHRKWMKTGPSRFVIPLSFAASGCFGGGLNLHTIASAR